MSHQLSKKIIASLFALVLGQLPPLMFIMLDLSELGLNWSILNAFDVYQSQKIYLFTSLSFPAFLSFIFLLIARTEKQKTFYQSILDEAQEMVIVLDRQHQTIYKNAAFEKFGLEVESGQIANIEKFPQTFELVKQVGGEQKQLLCSASHSEVRQEFTLIFRDITSIKQSATKIKQQEESILRSSQLASLGEISSGIAHEINNPLGVILANTGIMRDHLEAASPLVVKCLDTIDRMGLRIAGIIKAMKNLSRRSELATIEDVDLQLVLEDVTNLSMMNLRNAEITVHLNPATFQHKIVSGSSVQISQVLLNLIGNATQAVAALDEKWIRITCETDHSVHRIVVQNSGPQIPKHIQEKIFQPFFTTKSPGQGTGLGLSVSRNIAEVHRGALVLDGDNQHPTFIFSLPIKG
jgi:C4-dicarboxylate-specific signal transduction histidine kinase